MSFSRAFCSASFFLFFFQFFPRFIFPCLFVFLRSRFIRISFFQFSFFSSFSRFIFSVQFFFRCPLFFSFAVLSFLSGLFFSGRIFSPPSFFFFPVFFRLPGAGGIRGNGNELPPGFAGFRFRSIAPQQLRCPSNPFPLPFLFCNSFDLFMHRRFHRPFIFVTVLIYLRTDGINELLFVTFLIYLRTGTVDNPFFL